MKRLIIALMSLPLYSGCVSGLGEKEVNFEWINLNATRIKVVEVGGVPPNVMPGVLSPSQSEALATKTAVAVAYGPVHIKDRLTIIWQEGNVSHETEFKRDDLKIPARLTGGTLRFTYLGDDKWRVRIISDPESK